MSCAASLLWPHLPINPLGADGDNDKMCQYATQVVKGCHMTQSRSAHHVHTGPDALARPVRRPHQNRIFCQWSAATEVNEHPLPMWHMHCWTGAAH